jgi:predicted transcriptional regulator
MTESTFTFRVDEELKAEFAKLAKAKDRTAAQILREMMRHYVAEETPPTPEYIEWLTRKVEKSRASIVAGNFYTHEEMKARMAAQRAKWLAENEREKAA